MNTSKENRIIRKYSTISFDIFDTLIERDVALPTDIFLIAGTNILGKARAEEFRADRCAAETQARSSAQNGEATLDDIYEVISEKYPEEYQNLKEEEMKTEINSCHQKTEMHHFYESCISNGKNVFLISDMYLPESVIVKMLEHCGIEGYSKLYISNVYKKNKISGELFKIVLKDNGISTQSMAHIGDSIKADFLGAKKAGIKSVLIGRKNRIRRLGHK